MARHDIIVLGASAGGIEALKAVISTLPRDFPAALFAVVHIGAHSENLLAQSLARSTTLRVKTVESDEPIERGLLLVARADHHLLVRQDHVQITRGPRENLWRPSIDVLFRSAAVAHGPRVIGIILSGALDDGSVGVVAIKRCGGIAIAQEPNEALFPDMPAAAIRTGRIDHVLPTREIGPMLARLVELPADAATPIPDDLKLEADIGATGRSTRALQDKLGELSPYTCPECGGPLWKQGGDVLHFRCLIGHGYTANALLDAPGHDVDSTLWVAVRQFEQRGQLQYEMAEEQSAGGHAPRAAYYRQRAEEMQAHAQVLRTLLLKKVAS